MDNLDFWAAVQIVNKTFLDLINRFVSKQKMHIFRELIMKTRLRTLDPVIGDCTKAYQGSLATRAKCPLDTGRYKLEDFRPRLLMYLADLQLVAGFPFYQALLGVDPRRYCMDKTDAIRRLPQVPTYLAKNLGYCWVPAVNALPGDGLGIQAMELIVPKQTRLIEKAVIECEQIHQRIQHSFNAELKKIQNNTSELTDLIVTLIRELDYLIGFVDRFRDPRT